MSNQPVLPDLPGFNPESALRLLNNNIKLYSSVLKRFMAQYTASYDKLSAQLSNVPSDPEQLSELQREAHTLKGLAGTIGHPALQESATQFDIAAKNPAGHGHEEFAALAAELLGHLRQALDVLQKAFPEA